MAKEIKLTKGQVALVDEEDYEIVNKQKWSAVYSKHTNSFYAQNRSGSMHRLIAQTPKGMECDHVDGNTLNNLRRNLRNCTHAQNQMNSKINSRNTSGHKGVHRHKNGWRAQVHKDGRKVFRKTFPTLGEAVLAYEEMSVKYFGEFARTK